MQRCSRVLVVEDDPLAARAFSLVLRRGGLNVEVAHTVRNALQLLRSAPGIDGVVLDLMLPDGPGEQVLDVVPSHRVLVVTSSDDSTRAVALVRRGCTVLRKPVDGAALLDAVRWLLSQIDSISAFAAKHHLSPREAEVLRLTVSGMSAKEIAYRCRCAESTVRNHWHRIFAKTRCSSQREVLAKLHRDSVSH